MRSIRKEHILHLDWKKQPYINVLSAGKLNLENNWEATKLITVANDHYNFFPQYY